MDKDSKVLLLNHKNSMNTTEHIMKEMFKLLNQDTRRLKPSVHKPPLPLLLRLKLVLNKDLEVKVI
jgi:hypothetical protein